MAAAQPRNTSPSSLLSSSSDETFVAARLRKYSPPRSLSFRFLPCPALSTMLPIFPCSARISSSCVSARSNRKSGYPHTHTHVHVSITQSSAPLTFHRLDPEIRTINSNCISGPRGQRLSRVAISFFSIEPLLRRGYIYMFVSERLTFGSFSGCQRNPIPRSARASRNEAALEFECPEEFGYYPHPRDCTQYYVCVFGGALLESCTGGLMYR